LSAGADDCFCFSSTRGFFTDLTGFSSSSELSFSDSVSENRDGFVVRRLSPNDDSMSDLSSAIFAALSASI
jgi:hypothetical protein